MMLIFITLRYDFSVLNICDTINPFSAGTIFSLQNLTSKDVSTESNKFL